MIGKALDKTDMYKLLHHMSQIDQPWVRILLSESLYAIIILCALPQ